MEANLYLTVHTCSTYPPVRLNYDQLRKLGPKSILVQAVEAEPDLKELKLDHHSLTSDVMTSIQYLCEGSTPQTFQGLAAAGHYLNMPLLEFLGSESYPQVELFLQGKDLLRPETDYKYLLLLAAKNGVDTLSLYLLSSVSPEFNPVTEGKALIYAVIRQNLGQVKRLLQRKVNLATAAIEAYDDRETCACYGMNPGEGWQVHQSLILAAWYGYTGILTELLSHSTCQDKDLNPKVLFQAVLGQNVDCVRLVLNRTFVESTLPKRNVLYSALREAIKLSSADIIRLLLDDRRQTHEWDEYTVVPAVENNRLDILEMLLADPKCKTIQESAVNSVIRTGNIEMLRKLHVKLNFGPRKLMDLCLVAQNPQMQEYILSLPETKPHYAETFLQLCRNRSLDDVDLLRKLLLDPTVDPQLGLNEAILGNNPNVVQILLRDTRVDSSINHNQPIIIAVKHGCTKIVELLLMDPRVDPSDYDITEQRCEEDDRLLIPFSEEWHTMDDACRQTALWKAADEGYTSIVARLLQDPRVDPTHNDYAAIETAADEEILNLLLAHPKVKLDPERIALLRERYVNTDE